MKILILMVALVAQALIITAQNEREIVILHTNDSHGRIYPVNVMNENATSQMADEGESMLKPGRTGEIGGFAVLASAVKQLRKEHGEANVLLVDGGDSFSDNMLAKLTRGEANINLMNLLGYEFMAFGNHDFDFGPERTKELSKIARFPMRGANVIDSATGKPFLGDPFVFIRKNGINIGILALGYRNTPLTTSRKNVEGLMFEDSRKQIGRYLPELRSRSDIFVVISHEGLEYDRLLARENPGIDMIIGGHSHDATAEAEKVNETWIVQAFSHSMALGISSVTISGKSISDVKTRLLWLWHDSLSADKEFNDKITEISKPFKDTMNEVIGKASGSIPRNYKSGSPFDYLAGEILMKNTGSDAALLPGVGYGITINEGDIRRMDLYSMLPHESKLVTIELSGEQVLKTLEKSAENQSPEDPSKKTGGLIQAAGITWVADLTRPVGNRASGVKIGGQDLVKEKWYRIATHSGMIEGLHGYTEISKGRNLEKTDQSLVEMVEKYFKSAGKVTAPAPTVKLIK